MSLQARFCARCGDLDHYALPGEVRSRVVRMGCRSCGRVAQLRPHSQYWDGEWLAGSRTGGEQA